MHYRIKYAGGKFYTSTDMIADYYCRDSIPSLIEQMFNIGRFLPDIFSTKSISKRHLMPLLFTCGIIMGGIMSLISKTIFIIYLLILILYFVLITYAAIGEIIRTKQIYPLLLLAIIPTIHLSYGVGTIYGLVLKVKKISINLFQK